MITHPYNNRTVISLAASATSIAETLRSEGGEIRLELPYSAFSMLGALSEDRVFYRVAAGNEVLTGYDDLNGPAVVAGEASFATLPYDQPRHVPGLAVNIS